MPDNSGFSNEPIVIDIKHKMNELSTKMNDYVTAHNEYTRSLKRSSTTATVTKEQLEKMDIEIVGLRDEIYELLGNILPYGIQNQRVMQTNKTDLFAKVNELKDKYTLLKAQLNEPIKYEDEYQDSSIKYDSSFYHYIAYFLITLIIIVCVFLIYSSTDGSNIDLFIVVLALIVGGYHLYSHYFP